MRSNSSLPQALLSAAFCEEDCDTAKIHSANPYIKWVFKKSSQSRTKDYLTPLSTFG